jgi:hypothetical protein
VEPKLIILTLTSVNRASSFMAMTTLNRSLSICTAVVGIFENAVC